MTTDVQAKGGPTPLAGAWALLLGIALLTLGNGLQNSLLGVRANGEGFGTIVIGLIMTSFYCGVLTGALWAPGAIRRVGHIRVFAALASTVSVAILLHGLYVSPLSWGVLRYITGICISGVFIAAESWLNTSVNNENRGRMLALYMVVNYVGVGGGQLLLNTADTGEIVLFAMVSILMSLAMVPMLLSATRAPSPQGVVRVPLKQLYLACPSGVVGVFFAGIGASCIIGMGVVFASSEGYSVAEVSFFMASVLCGAALFQWPIGRLSDRIGRRKVILFVTVVACGLALSIVYVARISFEWLLGLGALYGGTAMCMYSLSLAYTNDWLKPSEVVGGAGGLVVIYGVGSITGPLVGGVMMGVMGGVGLFWLLAGVHAALALFVIKRMVMARSLATSGQGSFVALPNNFSTVAVQAAEAARGDDARGDFALDEAELVKRGLIGGEEKDPTR